MNRTPRHPEVSEVSGNIPCSRRSFAASPASRGGDMGVWMDGTPCSCLKIGEESRGAYESCGLKCLRRFLCCSKNM